VVERKGRLEAIQLTTINMKKTIPKPREGVPGDGRIKATEERPDAAEGQREIET